MADTVQMTLEQMLPELEDLVKHEVFSKDEIKKIVAKRTKFEEKLARSCEKKVYYEYIKYETLLEELKRKKVRRLGIKLHEFSKKSGLYHIRRLFQRALNRYYDDPKLWQDYITFLQNTVLQGSLAQVFISAIQKHPRNASLWKQAAFWEYSNNRNIHGARALFQRAIRLNPTSQEIWLNYFSLELRYLTDVRDNYKTAGLQVEDKPRGTNTSDFMAVSDLPDDESRKGSQDQLRQDIVGYAEEFLAKSKPFLEGGIPKIVFANAIKSFPNDFQFCAQFYELTTHITGLITLREDILQSIATNFSQDNEALFFIAKERTKLNYSFEACWTIFEEAIKGADNTKRAGFYDVYVLFHQHLLGLGTSQATAISKHMNAVLEEARSSQSLSETTFSIWIDTLVNSNNIPEAEKLSQQAVEQFPSSIKLWRARINFPLQRLSGSKADAKQALEQIEELYTKAFKAVQNKEASQALWIDYFKLRFEHLSSKFDETLEHYKKCLYNLLDLGTHVRMAFLALLQENKELNNINNVRKVYNLTLSIPPANAEYFLECIKAEQSHGGDVTKIRALFEKAVNAHDLWLEYIQFEYKNSNVTQGIHVYWKAKKALEDPTEFVRKYVLSTNGMDPAIANLE